MTSIDLSPFFAQQTYHGNHCTLGLVLRDLEADRATLLSAALAEPGLQHAAISRTLKTWGILLAASVIQRHRSGACACDR